jgi:hypothetical protein
LYQSDTEKLAEIFRDVCYQHDFGYRNFGKGFKFGRDENTRDWIDTRLLTEARRLCSHKLPARAGVRDWIDRESTRVGFRAKCRGAALTVWSALRHGGRPAFYG